MLLAVGFWLLAKTVCLNSVDFFVRGRCWIMGVGCCRTSFLWLSYRRNGMEAAKGIGFLMVSGCCSRSGMRRYLVNRSC